MLRLDQQTLNDKATKLSSDQLVAFGTLLLAAFTAASILVAVVLDSARVQCASIPEYTKRYAEIMNMYPPEGKHGSTAFWATLMFRKREPPDLSWRKSSAN
jgi:hypothetical protein